MRIEHKVDSLIVGIKGLEDRSQNAFFSAESEDISATKQAGDISYVSRFETDDLSQIIPLVGIPLWNNMDSLPTSNARAAEKEINKDLAISNENCNNFVHEECEDNRENDKFAKSIHLTGNTNKENAASKALQTDLNLYTVKITESSVDETESKRLREETENNYGTHVNKETNKRTFEEAKSFAWQKGVRGKMLSQKASSIF